MGCVPNEQAPATMEKLWKTMENYGKTMEWVRAPEGSKTIQTMENYGKLCKNLEWAWGRLAALGSGSQN